MFLVKKYATFKWKDTISGFPVSPGSAEVLARWCGKIKYVLIAYFLGNIVAKNCCNRTVYVRIIASQRWDTFWDTVYNYALQPNDVVNDCGLTKRRRDRLRDSTGPVGHRATGGRPVVCPIASTMEWATTGQKTRQHGLTSRPFSSCWALVSYVDGTQRL